MSDQTAQARMLLDAAHANIGSGNGPAALQCVVQVLELVGGSQSIVPAIKRVMSSMQSPQATDSAMSDLSALLSQVTLQTEAASESARHEAGTSYSMRSQHNGVPCNLGSQHQQHQPWSIPRSMPPAERQPTQTCSADQMDISQSSGGSASSCGWDVGQNEVSSSEPWQMRTQPMHDTADAPILTETGREGFTDCALADGSHFLCSRCGGVVSVARRQQHVDFWCES